MLFCGNIYIVSTLLQVTNIEASSKFSPLVVLSCTIPLSSAMLMLDSPSSTGLLHQWFPAFVQKDLC